MPVICVELDRIVKSASTVVDFAALYRSNDITAIVEALKSNTSVTTLDFGFPVGEATDDDLDLLLELLDFNNTLREIHLVGNDQISDELKDQIEAALQRSRHAETSRGDNKQGE